LCPKLYTKILNKGLRASLISTIKKVKITRCVI